MKKYLLTRVFSDVTVGSNYSKMKDAAEARLKKHVERQSKKKGKAGKVK